MTSMTYAPEVMSGKSDCFSFSSLVSLTGGEGIRFQSFGFFHLPITMNFMTAEHVAQSVRCERHTDIMSGYDVFFITSMKRATVAFKTSFNV